METWSSRGGNTYTPTQAPTCALTKFEATENFDRLRGGLEENKKKKVWILFLFREFAVFGLTDRKIMTSATCATSMPRHRVRELISAPKECKGLVFTQTCWIDWNFWCLSGLLYNSHKKRFNIPEYGWTRSLVSIVTLLSISLNIALLTDFSPAQIIKHSWRGGRCVDTDNNVSDSRQRNDLLACQNKPMSRCIYSPNRG